MTFQTEIDWHKIIIDMDLKIDTFKIDASEDTLHFCQMDKRHQCRATTAIDWQLPVCCQVKLIFEYSRNF